jgi:hypothetical protein
MEENQPNSARECWFAATHIKLYDRSDRLATDRVKQLSAGKSTFDSRILATCIPRLSGASREKPAGLYKPIVKGGLQFKTYPVQGIDQT